jgi:hypothetical protein
MTETRWTDELDPVLLDKATAPAPRGSEVVPLRGLGVELDVTARAGLVRLATSPPVQRAATVTRTVARHVGRAVTVAGRRVATVTVTAPAPGVSRAVGGFLLGRPMVGTERTDATFWRDGRRQDHSVAGESAGWSYRARWKRGAARLGVLLILWAVAYKLAPVATVRVSGLLAVLGLVWGAWGLRCWHRARMHQDGVLGPLHAALAPAVGQTETRPERWLHVPEDYRSNPGTEIRIDLPVEFSGVDKGTQLVTGIVKAKLGLDGGTTSAFHLTGKEPYAIFREPIPPPAKVTLDDIMPFLLTSKETAPIIGLTAGRKPVTIDIEADSPHTLLSAGSGAGKSVLIRAALAQALAKGGYGIILDVKMISQSWAKNLPNCEYHRTAESIHEALIRLRVEVDRRNKLVNEYADIDGNVPEDVNIGPRIWVVPEEMNATITLLKKYWAEIRDKSDSKTSPAVEALQDVLFMGRQIKIHVVTAAQLASARTMGGPEARENFGTRCLARYTQNAWKMLCPEIWPMPKKSRVPGRWQIVRGGEAVDTQVVFMTNREARELAQQGLPIGERREFDGRPVLASQPSHDRHDLGQEGETVSAGAAAAPSPADSQKIEDVSTAANLVGLREAIETGVVTGIKIATLRKAPQRDLHFPKPQGVRGTENLYDPEELGRWSRNRLGQDPSEDNFE